jgi:LacI family transcriptional regulator
MNDPHASRAVKLADVARRARVSTATVSRALSLPHKVKPATRNRVQAAVDALGYVAHGAARALASRRTHTIGAVIPTLDNAIFANTTHALQRAFDDAGYTLLLASHEFDPAAEVRATRTLIQRGVDALVLLGTTHDPEVFRMIAAHGVPYVLTWAYDRSGAHPSVGFDNRAAAMEVTEHLLGLGHRNIAMIAGQTANNERARERVAGVQAALKARGLKLTKLVEKPFTLAAGRAGLGAVLDAAPRPTAVICGNDVLAIGAIAEAHARGLRLPQELSVTGFDDMEIASLVTPALTTVHFPTQELGSRAAAHLLARLAGVDVPQQTELPVKLVVRESTAAPAAA